MEPDPAGQAVLPADDDPHRLRRALDELQGEAEFRLIDAEAALREDQTAHKGAALRLAREDIDALRAQLAVLDLAGVALHAPRAAGDDTAEDYSGDGVE